MQHDVAAAEEKVLPQPPWRGVEVYRKSPRKKRMELWGSVCDESRHTSKSVIRIALHSIATCQGIETQEFRHGVIILYKPQIHQAKYHGLPPYVLPLVIGIMTIAVATLPRARTVLQYNRTSGPSGEEPFPVSLMADLRPEQLHRVNPPQALHRSAKSPP